MEFKLINFFIFILEIKKMKIIALIATLFYVASATPQYASYRTPFPGPGGVTYVNGIAPVGLVAQPLQYASLHQVIIHFLFSKNLITNFLIFRPLQ